MATSLELSEKEVQIDHLHPKRFHFSEKIAKIGPADPGIICFREIIKKEGKKITEGKIYSPVGNLAKRAKKGILCWGPPAEALTNLGLSC